MYTCQQHLLLDNDSETLTQHEHSSQESLSQLSDQVMASPTRHCFRLNLLALTFCEVFKANSLFGGPNNLTQLATNK
ncbi:hypothetical protein BC941DRAFT_476322 [Chlamydoabsidia padenii]|nr:hypothetical protein BC941DRAFT_476322 [Chlamydoabsidia padenii]